MNLLKFRTNLMRIICSSENEAQFHALRMVTGGLSSPKTAKVINYAVRCMDDNEAYMEVGTYTGFTLCAAGYQNNKVCVGIDDLSMADFVKSDYLNAKQEEVRATIKANIDRMMNKRIFFIERDFRKVDMVRFDPPTLKIGVAYLDGYHDYAQTKQAIEWTIPQLSDEAVIIMDDVHLPGVYAAIMETVLQPKFYLPFLAMHTPEDWALDEYISTGLAVIQYKRNP